MSYPYYEIVTYSVSDPSAADMVRNETRHRLEALPGFIAWQAFHGAADPAARVDVVIWRTLEAAQAAAAMVGTAAEFESFRASIKNLSGLDHYRMDRAQAHPTFSGDGIELGRFRLKPGVSEEQMRGVYRAMVDRYLTKQPGWRRQHLVKLTDGAYMDVAFAESRERAEAICATWHDNELCQAFLALIEPEYMRFGTLL
jgi:hypothetical protein